MDRAGEDSASEQNCHDHDGGEVERWGHLLGTHFWGYTLLHFPRIKLCFDQSYAFKVIASAILLYMSPEQKQINGIRVHPQTCLHKEPLQVLASERIYLRSFPGPVFNSSFLFIDVTHKSS